MNTDLIEQNVHRLLGAMTGAATTAMVAVGDQLGLYRALAGGGPATPEELAARTGTAARYLTEWLSQQAAAGQRPVQPELVTDRHHGRGGRAGHRAEQPVHVLLDQFSVYLSVQRNLRDVDGSGPPPTLGRGRPAGLSQT